MDILKTILVYLSVLYVSSVQIAPDPATVNVTPSPAPTPYGIYSTATPVATPASTPVPTPAITANPVYGQLVMGDRNATVETVQRKLQELGYYLGEIDGAYGNQTRHAVEQFQYQNGLTVDGIAGKYTQTILFEADDVKAMPVVTNTPAFTPDETPAPPPVTDEPVATAELTAEPVPTDSPVPTVVPDTSVPLLMEEYSFVLDGFTETLTVRDTEILLHPVEEDEALYIPLPEILRSAGNVIIENTDGNVEEIAFSVISDFYEVSFTRDDAGSLSGLTMEKNTQLQPMTLRSAILIDGIVYLPLEDIARITGIDFTIDEATGMITVTMPSAG